MNKFIPRRGNRDRRLPAGTALIAVMAALLAALSVLLTAGCGSPGASSSVQGAAPASAGPRLYVAVPGSSDTGPSGGNSGFAMIDLATKQVVMVNIPEAKAPHGIIFTPDATSAAGTQGRTVTSRPAGLFLGNAGDGSVLQIDLSTNKAIKTFAAPPDVKLAIGGMDAFTDGKIYLSNLTGGGLYPFDPGSGTIGPRAAGADGVTTSISDAAWSDDGNGVYLDNAYAPGRTEVAAYLAKLKWPGGQLDKKIEDVSRPSPTGAMMSLGMARTPDGRFIYVADGTDGEIVKIDAGSDRIVKRIPVGKEPRSIVFSADGKTAYISMAHQSVVDESAVFVYDVAKDEVTDRILGIPAPLVGEIVLAQ